MRDLNGDEKIRLFAGVVMKKLANLVPQLTNKDAIDKLWDQFFSIIMCLKNDSYPRETLVSLIKIATTEWIVLYRTIYQSDTITPYMHTFCVHLHEVLALHGPIHLFTMQGMLNFYKLYIFKHFFI